MEAVEVDRDVHVHDVAVLQGPAVCARGPAHNQDQNQNQNQNVVSLRPLSLRSARNEKKEEGETQLVGDAVHKDVADARAAGLGEALVGEGRGVRAVLEDELVYAHVDEVRRVPWLLTSVQTHSLPRALQSA